MNYSGFPKCWLQNFCLSWSAFPLLVPVPQASCGRGVAPLLSALSISFFKPKSLYSMLMKSAIIVTLQYYSIFVWSRISSQSGTLLASKIPIEIWTLIFLPHIICFWNIDQNPRYKNNFWLMTSDFFKKRRGGDSNPRMSYPITAFPVLRLKPLGHLSRKQNYLI